MMVLSVRMLSCSYYHSNGIKQRNAIDWKNKKVITCQVEFYCHSLHKTRWRESQQRSAEMRNYSSNLGAFVVFAIYRYRNSDSSSNVCKDSSMIIGVRITLLTFLSFRIVWHRILCVPCHLLYVSAQIRIWTHIRTSPPNTHTHANVAVT